MSAPTAERPSGVEEAPSEIWPPDPLGSEPVAPSRFARAARRVSRSRPARAPRPEQEGTIAVVTTAFTMLALVSLWVAGQALVLSSAAHDRAQAVLYREFRVELSQTTAPLGPIVGVGDPVALISIPRIGVDEVVVEGTASLDTLAGPGHRRDTVLPGQEGVALVYGRAGTYGAPFAAITDLAPGDVIDLTTAQGEKSLTVIGVRHDGDPLPQPPAVGVSRLTLASVEGDGRLSALTANRAVFVDAEATEGFPAPPGRPTAVPDSERLLATDSGALPFLALCLALLLALTLGVVAARQRHCAALVWVIASPLAIALAWSTTDTVMRLLPNVL